jgi:hypothetical protein
MCITSLWIQRNRIVFHEEEASIEESASEYWARRKRQLTAITKRERRTPDKIEHGTRLLLCLPALKRLPQEMPPSGASLAQPPGHQKEPALLARLRINQTWLGARVGTGVRQERGRPAHLEEGESSES